MSDEEFRYTTVLRRASDALVRKRNRLESLSGARRYQSTERAVQSAGEQKTAVSDRLWSWIHHPDERVLLALLRNPHRLIGRHKDARLSMRRTIWLRAMASLEREGAQYGLLVDAGYDADIGQPRAGRTRPDSARIDVPPHWVEEAGLGDVGVVGFIEDAIGQHVTPWLARAEHDEIRRFLDAFPSRAVRRHAATHASDLDEAVVDLVMQDDVAGRFLARNAALEPGPAGRLMDIAIDMIAERVEDELPSRSRRGRKRRVGHEAMATLQALGARGVPLEPRHVERLLDLVAPAPEHVFGSWQSWAAAYALIGSRGLEPAHVMFLLERVADTERTRALRDIGLHPDSDESVWFALLSHARARRSAHVMEAAAKDPRLAGHPEIGALVAASARRSVEDALIEHGGAEAFGAVYHRVVERDPERVARALRQRDQAVLARLDPADLVPLLRHEDHEVRMLATRAMAGTRSRGRGR